MRRYDCMNCATVALVQRLPIKDRNGDILEVKAPKSLNCPLCGEIMLYEWGLGLVADGKPG